MTIKEFSPSILTQNDYNTYATSWVNTVSDPATKDLSEYFTVGQLDSIKLLTDRINFKAGSIAQLVSTVGASNIKARFILQPTTDAIEKKHFTLVLFATDAFNTRLSSYYMAEPYWLDTAATETLLHEVEAYVASGAVYNMDGVLDAALPIEFQGAVPDALAMTWVANWYLASLNVTINQGLLAPGIVNGSYGFLRGYTFDLKDFLAPLQQVSNFLVLNEPDTLIAIKLGLHAYSYANPNGDNVPTQTLGLIVQYPTGALGKTEESINATEDETTSVGSIDDDSVFYDMSAPCPPSC